MFFIVFSFLSFYDLNFLSNSVKRQIDVKNKVFRCLQDNSEIPLEKFSDNICDCCDCSDEFLNNTLVTVNRCEHKKISQSQSYILKDLFKKNILARNQIRRQNEQRIKQYKADLSKLQLQHKELLEKLKKNQKEIAISKKELKEWVYSTNGLKMPTEEEVRARREAYINRESHIESKKRVADEEEEEGFAYHRIEDTNFEEKKRRREEKWDEIVKSEYNELLERAMAKVEPKKGDFLSKLKDNKQTASQVSRYKELKSEKLKLRNDIYAVESQLSAISQNLRFNGNEIDPVWLSADNVYITGPVEKTKGELRVSLFRHAYIIVPPYDKYDLGEFYSLNSTMRFNGGRRMNDSLTASLNAFVFCHDKAEFFRATRQAPSRYTAWIGIPEACPSEYSDGEFDRHLSIIEPIVDKLVYDTNEL